MSNTINTIKQLDGIKKLLLESKNIDPTILKAIDSGLDGIYTLLTSEQMPKSNIESGNTIKIWSDGACTGNPGPGGWGTIMSIDGKKQEFSGGSRRSTNNIMELTGALEGIKRTPKGASLVVCSDSQYLVKGMTEWLKNWKRRGWKKADGGDVLNRDLWIELDRQCENRTIQWQWVKGHAGHIENERCDELARQAIPR